MEDKDLKKQIPLRISQSLWNDLLVWANDEFRSVNGQIEFLLTDCVKRRKLGSHKQTETTDTEIRRDHEAKSGDPDGPA